jgi:methionine biosynthesis protein MetW
VCRDGDPCAVGGIDYFHGGPRDVTTSGGASNQGVRSRLHTCLDVARYLVGGARYHLRTAPVPVLSQLDYEAYWMERGVAEPRAPQAGDQWDLPRFQAMAGRIRIGESVLDIGCGSGSFLAYLRDGGHTRLRGIDASAVAVASLRAAGFVAVQASLEHLDDEVVGRPDVLVLSEVLEHVVPFEDVLRRLVPCAGRVLISHPNIAYWPHRLRLLSGRFPIQWAWHPAEHVRFFSVTDLLHLFERERYTVLSIQTPIGFPSAPLRERFPNLLAGSVVVELSGSAGNGG